MSNQFRPRRATELLDVAFEIVRAHASAFGVLAVVAALPLLVGGIAMGLILPTPAQLQSGTPPGIDWSAYFLAFGISLAGMIWFFVAGASLVYATAAAFRGEPVDPSAALRQARARAGRLIVANIYKGIAFALAAGAGAVVLGIVGAMSPWLLVLAIPAMAVGGFVLLARAYVVTPVAALEDVAGTDAFARSVALTRGGVRRIAAILVVVFVVGFSLVMALSVGGALTGSVIVAVFFNSLWALLYPLANVFETVVYLDQRIRNEGYDLELMSRQLEAMPSLPSAPSGRRQPA